MKAIAFTLFSSLVLFSACSPMKTSSLYSEKCIGLECVSAQNKFKSTVGLVKQNQILKSYSSCLNLPMDKISETTKATFSQVKPALSPEGELKSFSSSMLMAVTQLASEVCNDLIAFEKQSSKKYFVGFDLGDGGSGLIDLESTIGKFASSCWGRNIYKSETSLIIEKFSNSGIGSTSSKGAALFLCTAMLSSMDVITN